MIHPILADAELVYYGNIYKMKEDSSFLVNSWQIFKDKGVLTYKSSSS